MKVKSSEQQPAQMPAISGIEAAPRDITAFAGLRVVGEVVNRLGLRDIINAHLSVKQRARGYEVADFILALGILQLCGTSVLDDLDRLRDDAELLGILGMRVPASTTAGDFLRKVTPGHIRQFEKLQRAALAAAHDRLPAVAAAHAGELTIDCDSTFAEVYGHQQGADRVHGGDIAFHPHFAFVGETREVLRGLFRRGRSHPTGTGDELIAFVKEAFASLPGEPAVRRFRGDSAYCIGKFMQWLQSEGVEFAVTARMLPNMQEKIAALPESAWTPEPGGRAGDGGTWNRPSAKLHAPEIAEFEHDYRSDDGSTIAVRIVVRRRRSADPQKMIGDTGTVLHAIATTRRDLPATDLLAWADDRANAENMVRELKSDLGACDAGLYQFFANATVMHTGMLAYNLISWLRLIASELGEDEAARWQARSWRARLFTLPGYLVRSGRQVMLRIAATTPVLALLTGLVHAICGSG